jgi:hypothetical protein
LDVVVAEDDHRLGPFDPGPAQLRLADPVRGHQVGPERGELVGQVDRRGARRHHHQLFARPRQLLDQPHGGVVGADHHDVLVEGGPGVTLRHAVSLGANSARSATGVVRTQDGFRSTRSGTVRRIRSTAGGGLSRHGIGSAFLP